MASTVAALAAEADYRFGVEVDRYDSKAFGMPTIPAFVGIGLQVFYSGLGRLLNGST